MTAEDVIAALAIPDAALVGQRVPKKLMLEQGAPTPADKRRIQDGLEELFWVAALKPTTIGVPAYRDDTREYLEVAVLTASLKPVAKPARLIELIHRAVPYPVCLLSDHGGATDLSLAHKRWSQGESGKVVLEELRQVPLTGQPASAIERSFLDAIRVSALPGRDLFALYDGLLARQTALEAALVTGRYVTPGGPDTAASCRQALDRRARLNRDLAILRATAHKERQLNRRVELNLEIKRLEAALSDTENEL